MTRPILAVSRRANRLIVSLSAIELSNRRGILPAVEALCRRVGIPEDVGSERAEIHVLLVDLEPRAAVEALRRAADAIGIDVVDATRTADRRLRAARDFIAARAEAAGLDLAIGEVIARHDGGALAGQLDFACIVRVPGAAIDEVLEAEDAARRSDITADVPFGAKL